MGLDPTDSELNFPEGDPRVAPNFPVGFESLVENAFDFLVTAVKEVGDRPKYSVIHFCAGIELLLKARLLHEHWSLVVIKPGETSKQKFEEGDFESVNMKQCFLRLEQVCGERLSEEQACFAELARERNKVVHFFHEAYGSSPDPKLVESIVIKQLKAGALLLKLLRDRWESLFEPFEESIDELESSLKREKRYLTAKFETVRPELDRYKAAGKQVWPCYICGLVSAVVLADDPLLKQTKCLVCEMGRNYIRIECPACKESVVEFDAGEGTCEKCDTPFDIGFLMQEFDAEAEAYCPECTFDRTVIEYGDEYLCLGCANMYDTIDECGWCAEPNAGDLENSYLIGCALCDGLTGHHAND